MLKYSESSLDSYNNNDEEMLRKQIMTNFYDLMQKHASEDDEEKKWMLQECKDPILLKHMYSMTGNMLHVLDAIGRFEPVNSIVISRDTGIPKGTVSKIIPKLIGKKFITKEGLPNNKKEFIFYITPLGKELFLLHQTLHKRTEVGVKSVLARYKCEDLRLFNRILEDFCKLSWVDEDTSNNH
jgi:DNA-binding MarR family transcriptional regulator